MNREVNANAVEANVIEANVFEANVIEANTIEENAVEVHAVGANNVEQRCELRVLLRRLECKTIVIRFFFVYVYVFFFTQAQKLQHWQLNQFHGSMSHHHKVLRILLQSQREHVQELDREFQLIHALSERQHQAEHLQQMIWVHWFYHQKQKNKKPHQKKQNPNDKKKS